MGITAAHPEHSNDATTPIRTRSVFFASIGGESAGRGRPKVTQNFDEPKLVWGRGSVRKPAKVGDLAPIGYDDCFFAFF